MLFRSPYQGAIRLRGTGRHILNQDTPHEHIGAPTGQEETFPHEDYDMPHPSRKHTISDISDLVSYPKRGIIIHQEKKQDTHKLQIISRTFKLQTNPLQSNMTKLKHTSPQ